MKEYAELELKIALAVGAPCLQALCMRAGNPQCFSSNLDAPSAEDMETSGLLKPGSAKEARKLGRFFRFEPVKYVNSVQNALIQGAGLSLDRYLPAPEPPKDAQPHDLKAKGCVTFLSDQESRKLLV